MPLDAAIYLRISRDLKGDGLAIDRQRNLCREIVTQRGWNLVEEYVDESISAFSKTAKRPGYDKLVEDYKANRFTAIVCYDLDRLTRQPRQLEDWIDAAEEKRLQLVTANGEADLSHDGGRMYARIKASVARAESERKGARQKVAAEQRARRGKLPLGTRITGYTSRGEVLEEEAALVRRVYKDFLSGESLRRIAINLTSEGVATRRGGKWSPSSVTSILRNVHYAGHGKYYDEILEGIGTWDALVSPDDFAVVQLRLDDPARKMNRTGTDRKYLGSGLYRCGHCGEAVSSFSGYRYSCRAGHGTRSAEPIDKMIVEVISQYLVDRKLGSLPDSRNSLAVAAEEAASQASRRLVEVEADYDAGLIDGRRYKAASDAARMKLAEATAEKSRLSYGSVIAGFLAADDPAAAFKAASLMQKRTVIETLTTVRIFKAPQGVKGFNPETLKIDWKDRIS